MEGLQTLARGYASYSQEGMIWALDLGPSTELGMTGFFMDLTTCPPELAIA